MRILHPISKFEIVTISDWEKLANPNHFRDGYSAMEIAKYWIPVDSCPEEIGLRLEQIEGVTDFKIDYVIPELQTTFDDYSNGRNHDLGIFGEGGGKRIFIGVEAKVAEPFDNKTFGQYLQQGILKQWKGISSKAPSRAKELFGFFKNFGKDYLFFDIKYQLIQSTVGVVAEAKKHNCDVAVFMVHQFKRNSKDKMDSIILDNSYDKNKKDWESFLKFLNVKSVEENKMYGPFFLSNSSAYIDSNIPFYVTYLCQ